MESTYTRQVPDSEPDLQPDTGAEYRQQSAADLQNNNNNNLTTSSSPAKSNKKKAAGKRISFNDEIHVRGGAVVSHTGTHSTPTTLSSKSPVTAVVGPSAPGTSGISSPTDFKQFRYSRSGYASPGGYSTYSSSTDRVGCLTAVRMTAWAKISRFGRRLVRFRQMDFEFAAWQMLYLLVQPQKVYRNFLYRKRTKDQFARDDPAFLVLLSASLFLTSVLYAVCLGLSAWGFVKFFLWSVIVDCLLVGAAVASVLWFIANRWLRKVPDQDVEWGYCFDVHLNAFFPVLILLHVLLPMIYPTMIDYPTLFPRFLGNAIWFAASVYYVYITFLGYTALPHLKNTQLFLYPLSFLFIFYIATVTAGWNISQTAMSFYHARAETHNAAPKALYPELRTGAAGTAL